MILLTKRTIHTSKKKTWVIDASDVLLCSLAFLLLVSLSLSIVRQEDCVVLHFAQHLLNSFGMGKFHDGRMIWCLMLCIVFHLQMGRHPKYLLPLLLPSCFKPKEKSSCKMFQHFHLDYVCKWVAVIFISVVDCATIQKGLTKVFAFARVQE